MAARLGRGGGGGGAQKMKGDARLKILNSGRGKTVDARQMLTKKPLDARHKLQKIRNLREGALEVKTVGGVTITKKIDGKIELSTKKNKAANDKDVRKSAVPSKKIEIGNFTKTVLQSGKVSLSTKKSPKATGMRSRSDGGGGGGGRVGHANQAMIRPERGRIGVSEYERMDEELMTARVDKAEFDKLKRSSSGPLRSTTLKSARAGRGASPTHRDRSRSPIQRSRSPMNVRSRSPRSRSPLMHPSRGRSNGKRVDDWHARPASPSDRRSGRFDYDTPRDERSDEVLRRRMQDKSADYDENYTMASRRDQVNTVSPLQGSKVVITNLQTSVTYDDIMELFGDVGALRKAKVATPGQAEVTFVNHEDAEKAVEIYHNRQLDGKPMKCTLTTTGGATMKNAFKLPNSSQSERKDRAPAPDLNLIHKALFLNSKKSPAKKQSFTITMPKKGKDEPEYYYD